MTLHAIKLLHTIVWAFFASLIVAIPFLASAHAFRAALLAIVVVAIEVAVLVLNGWRCPLTDIAARYTAESSANFDIYLPRWLAEHNKTVFGVLYLLGILWTSVEFVRS